MEQFIIGCFYLKIQIFYRGCLFMIVAIYIFIQNMWHLYRLSRPSLRICSNFDKYYSQL